MAELSYKEFVLKVIADEATCSKYLQENGLLILKTVCEKVTDSRVCGGVLEEKLRPVYKKNTEGQMVQTKIPTLRCKSKGCQAWKSIRESNHFFTYTDLNGKLNCKLKLSEIMEIVFLWVNSISHNQSRKLAPRYSTHTLTDWYNLCRDICADRFEVRGKMGGPGKIVQIDESLFQGKRKYNRGRVQLGDKKPKDDDKVVDSDEDSDNIAYLTADDIGDGDSDKENDPNYDPTQDFNRNYGDRVQGPWVFGLCCKTVNKETGEKYLEKRFFIVSKRDKKTLMPIIQNEIANGSTIHSDEYE